jgi:hypothetical protein
MVMQNALQPPGQPYLGGRRAYLLVRHRSTNFPIDKIHEYEVEEMHRQELRLSETVLEKEHLSTMTSMNNLAMVLSRANTTRQKR